MPHQDQGAGPELNRKGTRTEQRRALDDIFSLVYEELRRLASFIRRKKSPESPLARRRSCMKHG
jgi:hypothetical protein